MAFTIGKYGVGTLVQLGQLIICFYITCILFVVVVLGSIARATGFSIFKFIRYPRRTADRTGYVFFRIRAAAYAR
jgi:aerobic C4-dicarboxylate transport protein